VHLDWIQYRQNFREAVMVRRAVTGHSYEQALPGGKSDANHPDAVADSVTEFWSLLRELEAKNQLPPEIGVGSGTRAGLWLDRFRTLDQERGSGYYPRVRFLLSDYSLPLLDRAEAAVRTHRDVISLVPLDALNPYKTLSFLRYKILQVHLTNVYDTLPTDELVRVGDRFYLVQTRAYFPPEDAGRISEMFDIPTDELPRTIAKFLEVGPDYFPDRARGVAFWQTAWAAIRLQEWLVGLDEISDSALPAGLHLAHLEDLLGLDKVGARRHFLRKRHPVGLGQVPLRVGGGAEEQNGGVRDRTAREKAPLASHPVGRGEERRPVEVEDRLGVRVVALSRIVPGQEEQVAEPEG
jgi:hypothetical protein